MCFCRESNVCAKVHIFLKRKSFSQPHTGRRAPQGGLQRCSGVNQVSHGDTWSLCRDAQRGWRGCRAHRVNTHSEEHSGVHGSWCVPHS